MAGQLSDVLSRSAGRGDWLERADYVGRIARDAVSETEQNRTLAPPVVEAMKETGLFWMLMPEEAGGGGASIIDFIEVTERLCSAETSAGWSWMVNASITAAAAAFCSDEAVDEMFGGSDPAIFAGMLGPAGTAVEIEGGYRGGGQYSFASGSGHANWIAGGMLLLENGKPRMKPDGMPESLVGFLPKHRVAMEDNWHVMGLMGTGSVDYKIVNQEIASGFTMERTSIEPLRGRGLFKLALAGLACAGHSGVVLGLMGRALREIASIAQGKARPGYPGKIGEHPMFLDDFGFAEASYHASRNYLYSVFRNAEAVAESGGTLSAVDRARIRQVTTWVHQQALEVLTRCYRWAGSAGFREPSQIGLAMRDMQVAIQHVFVDPTTIGTAASDIIRDWLPAPDRT